MSQLSGAFNIEVPTERISRQVAHDVVAQLDQVDFVGALADAVTRRVTAALAAERRRAAAAELADDDDEGRAHPERPADTEPERAGRPWSGTRFNDTEPDEEAP